MNLPPSYLRLPAHLRVPESDDWSSVVSAPLVHRAVDRVSRRWNDAMVRDGLLVEVALGYYLRADAVDWPLARRLLLSQALPDGTVAALSTAVWAHGGPAPRRDTPLHAIARPGTGQRTATGLSVHRFQLSAEHVQVLDGLAVTTRVRTAADLAFYGSGVDEAAFAWVMQGVRPSDVWQVARARGRGAHRSRVVEVLSLHREGHAAPLAEACRRLGPPRQYGPR